MDFSNAKLPPLYKSGENYCYMDPIRQKLVNVTPEEKIRQLVISYLLTELSVPKNMIAVEEPISHYGVRSKDRADIVIRALRDEETEVPVAVIECKAPEVSVDDMAVEQAFGYADAIGCDYVLVTNGDDSVCFKYMEAANNYIRITDLPTYQEMIEGKYIEEEIGELPERIPFLKFEEALKKAFDEMDPGVVSDISLNTPLSLAVPLFNLWEGILDVRVKMPAGDYGLFRIIEDCGVLLLTIGNGSGGKFSGPYRVFRTEVNGVKDFFALAFSTYRGSSWKDDRPDLTSLCVAHSDGKHWHHSLQLICDEECVVEKNTVRVYHSGRIAIGRIGSGKKSELMELVRQRYSQIIEGDRYYLGSITHDHLLTIEDQDVKNLITNLIAYAAVRDEYREIVKSKTG